MKTGRALLILYVLIMLMTPQSAFAAKIADAIYFGGPIVTMIRDNDRVEALAVYKGTILATGSKKNIMAFNGAKTKLINLNGHCLMPGFIDPHSHVSSQSVKFSTVNLDPHPIGDVKTIADIQRKLREHIKKNKPENGKWVIGWGYDDTGLKEMRHPTRDDLDAVSKTHPILLVHISSHIGTCNSKALEIVGITADTPDPDGGKFQRKTGSREPNGVLEETAWFDFVTKVPLPTKEASLEILKKGLAFYAAAGITTAGDGASTAGVMKLFRILEKEDRMPIDVVAYPAYNMINMDVVDDVVATWKIPARFRPGGIKLFIDGSLQGYTGFLSKPYYKQVDGKKQVAGTCGSQTAEELFLNTGDSKKQLKTVSHEDNQNTNRGYASMSLEQVTEWVRICNEKNIPIHAHCNGDAAVDILLEALNTVYGDRPRPELRNVIIHAQTIRDDQLNAAVSHGLVPSFFPIHIVFWGDRHRDIFLGPKRAARINPARSALDRGMKITLHHDAPIASIEMLSVVDAAVNRITSSGKLLGPDERITPYEALRAITKDAAWQYFEENRKGTLESGKLADMVILDADPLAIDLKKIGKIKVIETIKEGKIVFSAK